MDKYTNFLLALGITISGSQLVGASENLFPEDMEGRSSRVNKSPSPVFRDSVLLEDIEATPSRVNKSPSSIFLEIGITKDANYDDHNAGCSVTNSGCSG